MIAQAPEEIRHDLSIASKSSGGPILTFCFQPVVEGRGGRWGSDGPFADPIQEFAQKLSCLRFDQHAFGRHPRRALEFEGGDQGFSAVDEFCGT